MGRGGNGQEKGSAFHHYLDGQKHQALKRSARLTPDRQIDTGVPERVSEERLATLLSFRFPRAALHLYLQRQKLNSGHLKTWDHV